MTTVYCDVRCSQFPVPQCVTDVFVTPRETGVIRVGGGVLSI